MFPSRRVLIAFAVSLLVHGIFFAVLALNSQPAPALADEAKPDDKPLEVVFQAAPKPEEEPPPVTVAPAPQAPLLMRMDLEAEKTTLDPVHLKKSEKAPENATFLASHHSQATRASKQVASPLPKPTPVDAARLPSFRTALPTPSPSPATFAGDESAPEESEEGSVAAIGAWKKAVANAIGTRWDEYRQSKLNLLAVGSVRMKFTIDARGRISDVRALSNTAGAANAGYAKRSITEAEIPPIPPERLARLPGGRVEVEYTFTILPAQ